MRSNVTRVSSRGQVVIPAAIRGLLHLAPGDELVVEVAADERTILLRAGVRLDIEHRLEQGYLWLEQGKADPVRDLQRAREGERSRERQRRSP